MRASYLVLATLTACTLYDRGLVSEDGGVADAPRPDVPGLDVGPDAFLDVKFVDGGPEVGPVCPRGTGDCDLEPGCETSLLSNELHCGECNNNCGTNSGCSGGFCSCSAGFADCTTADGCETDLRVPTSCGSCDAVCGANAGCAPGIPHFCECNPGWGDCDDDLGESGGNGCETELNTDAACGACGAACLPGQMCEALGVPPTPTCDGCGLLHPPNRVLGTSGPDTGSLVFALRDPVIDQDGIIWQQVAFDVDDHCTDPAGATAICQSNSMVSADGPNGIDNVLGRDVLAAAGGLLSGECPLDPDDDTCTFPERVAQLMELGQSTTLLILSAWDGTADDDQVRIEIAQAAGFSRIDMAARPQWDGDDIFFPSTASYDAASIPFVFDDFAYITDNTLVMRVPNGRAIDIPWPGGNPLEIDLADAFIVADIQLSPLRLRNVKVGGRYPVSSFATNLEQAGVCEPPFVIPAVVMMAQNLADVMSSTTLDIPMPIPPSRTCNAISAWLGFTGYPVVLGSPKRDPPPLLDATDC